MTLLCWLIDRLRPSTYWQVHSFIFYLKNLSIEIRIMWSTNQWSDSSIDQGPSSHRPKLSLHKNSHEIIVFGAMNSVDAWLELVWCLTFPARSHKYLSIYSFYWRYWLKKTKWKRILYCDKGSEHFQNHAWKLWTPYISVHK